MPLVRWVCWLGLLVGLCLPALASSQAATPPEPGASASVPVATALPAQAVSEPQAPASKSDAPPGGAASAAGVSSTPITGVDDTGAGQSSQAPTVAPSPKTPTSGSDSTSQPLRMVLSLTVLALLPSLLVCLTAFLRIIIVLSMLRHAIGLPETPPNVALIGLALFLTLFTMQPTLSQVNDQAFTPYWNGQLSHEAALSKGMAPLRDFMVRQTREQDMALMIELAKAPQPDTIDDVSNLQLIPAFMLSELRTAFQIGFMVFLPFLLIDLIVASTLMSLGMMMMPPTSIALPLKLLLFILVDGWALLIRALLGSFH